MDPADVQSDIERHREDLGRTVDELTERLDVKEQAKRQAADLKAQGEQRGKQPEESHGVTLALPGKCRVRAGVGPG